MKTLVAIAASRAADADLNAALTAVCLLARQQQVTIERILIVLRAEWEASGMSRPLGADSREPIRSRLASEFIRIFYDA